MSVRRFNVYQELDTWSRYRGGRRPSSDNSLHSPTVIPPSALDKPCKYHEELPSSANVQSHLTSSFADDGLLSADGGMTVGL